MKFPSSMQWYGPAIAIACASVLAWLVAEPFILLVVIVAVCLHGDRRLGLLSIGMGALAFALLVAFLAEPNPYLQFAIFLAAALAVAVLVFTRQGQPSSDHLEGEIRLIVESMPDLAWACDPRGNFMYVSPSVVEFFGRPGESFGRIEGTNGFGWEAVVHPEDAERAVTSWLHSLETGEPYMSVHRARRADGAYRWLRSSGRAKRDLSGRITGWYGTTIDVEEPLRKSEQQLCQLVDTIPTLLWSLGPDGDLSYLNKPLMDYIGFTLMDFERPDRTRMATGIDTSVHPDDRAATAKALGQSFATGAPYSIRHRILRRDGVYRWVDARAQPLRDEHGRIVQWYGVSIDIDDEKRMLEALRTAQDRLSRASQLASLAELSASIAHEINQPLAAVITNSEACKRWLAADPINVEEARATAERIIRDANSAAEVIDRIRALFKHSALTKTRVNLNDLISEVWHLLNDEITSRNIHLEIDLDEKLPSTLIDRVQIQQVLANLVRNGIDAMEATREEFKSLGIRSRQEREDALVVEVRDHGTGIQDPDRIFEPFFTTKEKGMGMGLAICRSIIEAHEGRLWARPNEPRGSVFTISLPLRERDS